MTEQQECILHIIKSISDTEYQEKVWLKSEFFDPYFFYLGEAIGSLDGFFFFEDVENNLLVLSENNSLLSSFCKAIVEYFNAHETASAEQIISDTEWLKIVEIAKILYPLLRDLFNA